MKPTLKQILFWAPRVLSLLFATFISIFALDVFNESHGFWQTALALLMHLIPTIILLALLAVSWRWEWVGGVVFPALGLIYLVNSWGRFHWSAYVLIAGPLFLLGTLFLLSWRQRKNLQDSEAASA
jgi:hypothetical protein